MWPSEAYVELALFGISVSQSAGQLRKWWDDERERREQYRLSEEQLHLLVNACREHLERLGEYERERLEEEADQQPKRRSSVKPQRRSGAI